MSARDVVGAAHLGDRPLGEGGRVRDGFTPAAEIVKDGDDAVIRLELPGVDVAKDVNVEVDRAIW